MPIAIRTKKFTPKPANPQADPRFKKVKNNVEQKAQQLKKHPSAKQKSNEAAKAAKGPPNEKAAGAKANQVDSMKDTKAEVPAPESFLTVLRAEIDKVMPSNLDDAKNFMDGGAEDQMKGAVGGNVKDQKDTASGDLQAASDAPPKEGGVQAKPVEAVPPDPAVTPPAANGGSAMPAPLPDADVSQKQTKADAQTAIKDNKLDGKRGENKHPASTKLKPKREMSTGRLTLRPENFATARNKFWEKPFRKPPQPDRRECRRSRLLKINRNRRFRRVRTRRNKRTKNAAKKLRRTSKRFTPTQN